MHILTAFRETGALLDGHFILRSGRHSRQFFQCAHLLQYPRIADDLSSQLAEQVKAHGLEFDAVISPAMGGILVGHDLGRRLDKRHLFTEKEDGVLKLRRFKIQPGDKFLIAEDVVTTGSAVREVIRIVTEAGGIPVGVAVLVDRSGAAPVEFGVPFFRLVTLTVETFDANDLPPDLAATQAVKPGSK